MEASGSGAHVSLYVIPLPANFRFENHGYKIRLRSHIFDEVFIYTYRNLILIGILAAPSENEFVKIDGVEFARDLAIGFGLQRRLNGPLRCPD
jgi:hypothetical protein